MTENFEFIELGEEPEDFAASLILGLRCKSLSPGSEEPDSFVDLVLPLFLGSPGGSTSPLGLLHLLVLVVHE